MVLPDDVGAEITTCDPSRRPKSLIADTCSAFNDGIASVHAAMSADGHPKAARLPRSEVAREPENSGKAFR
jgi:hypothetical protein